MLCEKRGAPGKKTRLISSIVALMVVIASVVCFLPGCNDVDTFTEPTMEPDEYLVSLEKDAIARISDSLAKGYGATLGSYSADISGGKISLGLNLSEDILTYAESMLEQQGMATELDWLKNINISLNATTDEKLMQLGLILALGNNDLVSADAIFNMDSSLLLLTLPELSKDYLSIDFSEQLPPKMLEDSLAQSAELAALLLESLPTEQQLKTLITTYAGVVLDNIDEVEKSNETITVGDATQDMVVLTTKITTEDILDIYNDVLKYAQTDETLKAVLDSYGKYINKTVQMNGYTETLDLHEIALEAISEALDALESAKEDMPDGYMDLKVYVDKQNNIRGHVMSVYIDAEKIDEYELSYLTAVKDDTTYLNAEFNMVKITGQKITKDGVSEGHLTLVVEDEEMATLEFENVAENRGTLRLFPGEALLDEALSDSGVPTFLLSDNLGIELSYDMDGNKASCKFSIIAGSKALIDVTLSSEVTEGGSITYPSNIVETENLAKWLAELDFDKLTAALEKANVPAELVDMVEYYEAYFKQTTPAA